MRLSELSTAFSNNVLDATKAFELVVTDAADVEGLPPSAKGAAAEKAASADKCEKADADNGPWLLGLDAPSYFSPRGSYFDESRRRRGRDVDILWRGVAATPRPRRGYSMEASRGRG